MLSKADDIIVLFSKHLQGELSDAEKKELDDLLASSENIRQMFARINSEDEFISRLNNFYSKRSSVTEEEMQNAFRKTLESTNVVRINSRKKLWFKWVAAASVLLIAGASYFIFFNSKETVKDQTAISQPTTSDVAPGSFKAKLTLADGRTIILDSAAMGELARQGNAVVINKDGQIIYTPANGIDKDEVLYNMLSTARGETYSTVLADGSKVWLNAASSIRYPVTFSGNSRKVEITGEAYFEVAKDVSKPFHVAVNGTTVEVLGTHFNVNAYNEEPEIKTSLLEGKVKVTSQSKQSQILIRGQQASVSDAGAIELVKDANVQGAIAWKNGIFNFQSRDMQAVMRQLALWYDVEVVYESSAVQGKITGNIERNIPLSKVLSNLEKMVNAKFTIQGKKIIVSKP